MPSSAAPSSKAPASTCPSDNPGEAKKPPVSKLPTVRLKDVCRLADDRRVSLSVAERTARTGPYPLYAENATHQGIDEYALEAGGTILVAGIGQVVDPAGRLYAVLEPGRCSASEHMHALVPFDPADARYIWRALTTVSDAQRYVVGSSQVRQLSGPSLMNARIPWPDRAARDAFVEALDRFDRESKELARRVPQLMAQGDEAFARIVAQAGAQTVDASDLADWRRGTDVPAADRAPGKRACVEGPAGELGFCDESLAEKPMVVVGPAGGRMLAHYLDAPAHPIAEMLFATADDARVPLPVVLFSLRAAGVIDRLRIDGRPVDLPRLKPADFPKLQVVVGAPEAQAEFARLATPILDAASQACRDAETLVADREALLSRFARTACVDPDPVGLAVLGGLPEPSGMASAGQGAQTAALVLESEKPLYSQAVLEDLGPLAALVQNPPVELEPCDLAWELGPLACVRVIAAPADWAAVAAAAASEVPGHPDLLPALDLAMGNLSQTNDLLTFLPNLTYQSSLLSPDQLADWVKVLDGIAPGSLTASSVRAVFALDADATRLPKSVRSLVRSVLRSVATVLPAGFETAYVPCEAAEGMVDLLADALPEVTFRAQFDDFAHMLAAAMVRAVEVCGREDECGGLGAAAGNALEVDEFADWKAPLVVAALPPNAGQWTSGALQADDPRWVLGIPPRNKANFAWIQQVLSHLEQGGLAVLLVCNSVLHSTLGSERGLRQKLAESGRVRLVASLPGRIFGDCRPAMSLLVVGEPRPEAEAPCLMVDALGLAVPAEEGRAAAPGASERMLPCDDADRIAAVCSEFIEHGAVVDQPGLSCTVTRSQIVEHEGLLTPWTYVEASR